MDDHEKTQKLFKKPTVVLKFRRYKSISILLKQSRAVRRSGIGLCTFLGFSNTSHATLSISVVFAGKD